MLTMTRMQAYRYALAPTKAQEAAMSSWASLLRFVWNWMLQQRRDTYAASEGRVRVSYEDQANQLPAMKAQFPFLAAAPHHVLQQSLRDLDRAFVNFFVKHTAYPQFKSKAKGDIPGMRFPDAKQFRIVGNRIFLPKLGWVKFHNSRPIKGTPKNATVTFDGLRWFVSIQTEREVPDPSLRRDAPLGLDAGVANSLAASDGRMFALPVASDTEEKRLAQLARGVSRKKVGSHRHAKAKKRLLKAKRRIQHRVKDARHKLTTALAQAHGIIAVEDLNLRGMTVSAKGTVEEPSVNVAAKRGLNRALLEQGHFETFRQLDYKLAWNGGVLVGTNPANSSRECACCGHVAQENRESQAVFLCVSCGHKEHADTNAAVNLKRRGLGQLNNTAAGQAVAARGATPKATRRNANPKTRAALATSRTLGIPAPKDLADVNSVTAADGGKAWSYRVTGLDAKKPIYADHEESDHAKAAGFPSFADFLHAWRDTGARLDAWAWVIEVERVRPEPSSKGPQA